MTRVRTIIRRGVRVGSSDVNRARAAMQSLREEHEQQMKSASHALIMSAAPKEPSGNTEVQCWCLTGWVKVEYSKVKSAKFTNWKY